MQGIFGNPIYPIGIPKNAIIICPHLQYVVKKSGIKRARMCCNGSKKPAPQLYAVVSTWYSCVAIPI